MSIEQISIIYLDFEILGKPVNFPVIEQIFWIHVSDEIQHKSNNFPRIEETRSIYIDWDIRSWLENVIAVSHIDHTYTENITGFWETNFVVADTSFSINVFENDFREYAIKYERIGDYINIGDRISISAIEREIHRIRFNLSGYTYKQLVNMVFEEIAQREKFLPDYHIVRYIQSNAKVPAIDIGRVLTEIRNIFAIMDRENIDEAHFLTFRVVRWKYDPRKKSFFVVTDW